MRAVSPYLAVLLLVLSACVSMQPPAGGTSRTDAVRLRAPTHDLGLKAEAQWLDEHFPGWRFPEGGKNAGGAEAMHAEGGDDAGREEVIYFSHRTEAADSRIYSVYTIQLSDGRVRDVYFDQSQYFGRTETRPTNR